MANPTLSRRTWLDTLDGALERWPWLVALGLVILAAVLRLPDLPARGQWDADQGNEMLVLRAFVRDGQIPLLGPPTSSGGVHHGALYYLLLAPVAAVTGGDSPVAIIAAIALANIAAVVMVWWLARSIGGPIAGAIAGLLVAISPSAIEESVFIWNPNLIAISSTLAMSSAWQAWRTQRTGWWLLAGVGATLTMHFHLLGVVLLPPLIAALIADVRRRTTGADRLAVLRAGLGWLVIVAVSYVPLAIHELTHDFAETRAALGFLASSGTTEAGPSLPVRLLFVGIRLVSWPSVGLVTGAPEAALLVTAGVLALVAWLSVRPDGTRRAAARWSLATLAWTTVALAIAVRSLATVVPGLPNDHYHAFINPIVFVATGVGLAAVARANRIGAGLAAASAVALLVVGLVLRPPPVHPDGGWPRAEIAGNQILALAGDRPIALIGLPVIKSTDAYGYPLVRAGREPVDAASADVIVVLCDRFFEATIGASCGGPAEDIAIAGAGRPTRLIERFDASPRTVASVYALASP